MKLISKNPVGFLIHCLLLVIILGLPGEVSASPPELIPLWGPYLTNISETGVSVNCRTENEVKAIVRYTTQQHFDQHNDYSHEISDSKSMVHHLHLTGLTPNTRYVYQVKVGGKRTSGHSFRTLGSNSFSFIVYGDSQEQAPSYTQLERHKLVADRIANEDNISFVLHAGDLVGDVESSDEWDRFFEAGRNMFAETPIFPVLGNHENHSPNYYEAFGVPQWYSFNCSSAHFAMLDSNRNIQDQAQWLASDLGIDAQWKFAVCHHPPYSSNPKNWGGWQDIRASWEPLFIEEGVTAVFNGHVHAYERYRERGIDYAVLGIGGGPSYELAEEKISGYRNSLENVLGYARVTVNPDEAKMEIIRVADVSSAGVEHVYPPNTIFETVILDPSQTNNTRLTVTANVLLPTVGIMLDRESIDYGDVVPGGSSEVMAVSITSTGTADIDVSVEMSGGDDVSQDFYRQSLYFDGSLYQQNAVITSIDSGESESMETQLHVPSDWTDPGVQEVRFVFWAEAI